MQSYFLLKPRKLFYAFHNSHRLLKSFIYFLFASCAIFFTIYYYQTTLEYNNLLEFYSSLKFNRTYQNSQIEEQKIQNGYLVWSSTCRIPDVDPYHESIKKFIFKWNKVVCSTKQPLTQLSYNSVTQEHSIEIRKDSAPKYAEENADIICCYSIITRKHIEKYESETDDDRHDYSEFVCFENHTILPKGTEFVYVKCNSKSKSVEIHRTIYGMVVDKDGANDKLNSENSFSVLLLGIDSISRLNMIRTMPKTWEYVQKNQWISLEGYTKVGDNTLPNLMAILTGMKLSEVESLCVKHHSDDFDDCPFIWKEFKRKSYITAYIEDSPEIGSFNFHKYGFRNSPTDYYTRPLVVAGTEKLEVKWDGLRMYCLGEQTQAEYLLQYTYEFVKRFSNRPYFNLFWLNSFSHDELNQPQTMDSRYRAFLEDIQPYLNSTIVIFFSDHGMRFGNIRKTYVGWLEERMPFITFSLPQSFKKKFPQKYGNLIRNKNRLTSPFDLHATLQDILYGNVKHKPVGCPLCDTLFKKVSMNRTCEEAAISPHWCTCSASNDGEIDTNDPVILSSSKFIVHELNNYLIRNKNSTKNGTSCAALGLKRIISVRKITPITAFLFSSMYYVIVLETEPSGAVFEATVKVGSSFQIENEVSRINAYGNQSSCVLSDSTLIKYCFCIHN